MHGEYGWSLRCDKGHLAIACLSRCDDFFLRGDHSITFQRRKHLCVGAADEFDADAVPLQTDHRFVPKLAILEKDMHIGAAHCCREIAHTHGDAIIDHPPQGCAE
jgi:hypothetical protein